MTTKNDSRLTIGVAIVQMLFLLWRTTCISATPASFIELQLECDDLSLTSNCQPKPSVHLCCPPGKVLSGGCQDNETFIDVLVEVQGDGPSNHSRYVDLFKEFNLKMGKPCDEMMILTPELYPEDEWILFEVYNIQ